MQFSLESDLIDADKATLVLHIDGSSDTFAFSDKTSDADHSYQWDESGLNWSSENFVTLRLRDGSPTAPAINTPALPTNLTATADGTNIKVGWAPPIQDGSPVPTSYVVRHTNKTTNVSTDTLVPSGTTLKLRMLDKNTAYEISVAARTSINTGTFTEAIEITTHNTPGVPTSTGATASGTGLVITWEQPNNDGGTPIEKYLIRYREANTTPWTKTETAGGNRTHMVPDQEPGTEYEFRIAAKNKVGDEPLSTRNTGTTAAIVPSEPTNVQAQAGTRTITMSWSPPDKDGGTSLTGYRIELTKNGGATLIATIDVDHTASQARFSNLTPNTLYEYQVTASNNVGPGDPSTVREIRTEALPPPPPPTARPTPVPTARPTARPTPTNTPIPTTTPTATWHRRRDPQERHGPGRPAHAAHAKAHGSPHAGTNDSAHDSADPNADNDANSSTDCSASDRRTNPD